MSQPRTLRKALMMWWILLLTLLVLFGIYLLFAPLVLFIDTKDNTYFLKLKGLAKASFEPDKLEFIKIKLRIAFMNFDFYPLRKSHHSKKEKVGEKKLIKKRNIGIKQITALLKSFKLEKLYLNLDTGDFVLNAKLYPIFHFLDYRVGRFNINFQGNNRMVLMARNRPINIIKVFINS
ncbi:hypothetical protein [Flagellimonas sp.]|uniref:hypothetical protein n=1 Tax=Flagellimonas sp. TaxID=2058762 RepID=UPI003B58F33B